MNKVILMGRLTRDPDIRYSQGERTTAVARFSLAVDRRFKQEGQPSADFINCLALGKNGEFVEKYLRKGTKVYTNDCLVESCEFAESKAASQNNQSVDRPEPAPDGDGFMNIPDGIDEELPFN